MIIFHFIQQMRGFVQRHYKHFGIHMKDYTFAVWKLITNSQ